MKKELAFDNGADHVIDLSGDNLKCSIRDNVRDIFSEGVDIVIEIIGGEVFEGAIRALSFGGTIVVVGFTCGDIPTLKANYTLLKNIAVTGVNWAEYRNRHPNWVQRVQAELFAMVLDGKLRIPLQETFAMEDIAKACEVFKERNIRGKLLLQTGA